MSAEFCDLSGEDVKRIWHTLELARTEANRGRPDLARHYLSEISREIDQLEGSVCWAAYSLALAEVYAVSDDDAAGGFFEEAIERMNHVSDFPAQLKLHVHEDFGKYLSRQGYRSKARLQFETAKKMAVELNLLEVSAKNSLRLMKIDLELDGDPQLASFQNMKKAALDRGETHQAQLAVWLQHWGSIEARRQGLKFARNERVASKEYFAGLFCSCGAVTTE